MRCENFREIVCDLAAGLIEKETYAEAIRHMEGCPQCRAEYEKSLEMASVMAQLGTEEAPSELLPSVMAKIAREKAGRRFRVIQFSTAAAAAIFLVAGSVMVLPRMRTKDLSKSQYELVTEDNGEALAEDDIIRPEAEAVDVEEIFANDGAKDTALPMQDKAAGPKADIRSAPSETDKASPHVDMKGAVSEAADEVSGQTKQRAAYTYSAGIEVEKAMPEEAENGNAGGAASHIMMFALEDASGAEEYVCVRCKFVIEAAFAESVKDVTAEGKTSKELSAELYALGVQYAMYFDEENYTDEYETASEKRRAEIEALCAREQCTVTVE